MAFVEDKAVFLNPNNPGVEAATYTPAGGTARSVNGQFWRTPAVESGMEGSDSTFLCDGDDVPGVRHFDRLVIHGITYVVRGKNGPDESGWVELGLELADG